MKAFKVEAQVCTCGDFCSHLCDFIHLGDPHDRSDTVCARFDEVLDSSMKIPRYLDPERWLALPFERCHHCLTQFKDEGK